MQTGTPPIRPIRRHWFELPARAALVGLMVGSVVTLSRTLGPSLTGMAAVFPVAFTSFTFLVLPRVGGVVGAAIMVSAIRAMPGFALVSVDTVFDRAAAGVAVALVVALLPSLAWSALLMIERGLRLRMA